MKGNSGRDRADPEEATTDPQSEVVRAFADPAFYPDHPASVEHLRTHISHVFLAGPYVYKLKKPVHFPFLDARAAKRRRARCEDECRLNRRLAAPPVYLDVRQITREGIAGATPARRCAMRSRAPRCPPPA